MFKEKIAETTQTVAQLDVFPERGRVAEIVGDTIISIGPKISIGSVCKVTTAAHGSIKAEVTGFKEGHTILMPFGPMIGLAPGDVVSASPEDMMIMAGDHMLGRVIDAFGEPLDEGDPFNPEDGVPYTLYGSPMNPLNRARIKRPISTGVRAIDGFLTCGCGQRFGVFAGSGVGKSMLLGMIAKNSSAHVNVIALIGERGREVREFIEKCLGKEGLARSVVVVVTSDQPSVLRVKGVMTASAIAEYFRDQGKDVMLMVDSITRVAFAQREIGLAAGEPPTTRGYTPSVFGLLPKLLERAGTSGKGTITGIYAVLVEQDDVNEPISDAIRAILDGHIILSRELAAKGHYPAVDVLGSISRVMMDIMPKDHIKTASFLRDLMAVYKNSEDLINIGAYKAGTNARIDAAVAIKDSLDDFLRQDVDEKADVETSIAMMESLISGGSAA